MPTPAPMPAALSVEAWLALDYAAVGVGQYWLVDPEALEVLVLDAHRRFTEVLAAAVGTHDVPACEGLRLDLDALWAEVDRGAAFLTGAQDGND